jgi:hypothetical protein
VLVHRPSALCQRNPLCLAGLRAFESVEPRSPSLRLQKPLLDLLLTFKWHSPNSRHAQVLAAYSEALVQAVTGSKGVLTQVYKVM